MSTYRLKIKCNNAQLEVVAKSGALLAYELDRYLESFLNRKIESAPYSSPKVAYTEQTQQQQEYKQVQQMQYQQQVTYAEPVQQQVTYTQPNVNTFTVEQTPPQPQAEQQAYTNTVQQDINSHIQQEAYISLADFLNSNKSGEIFSDFIISAYYIKRVLNISCFSVKMLNSKFYPATGKLVDLSIVDEARTRGFIETKEEDGTLKYSLSPAGESYFINQLRG